MAISVENMSRPNRQEFNSRSHPFNPTFDNLGSDDTSYGPPTGGHGGPHGHISGSHRVPDAFSLHSGGPLLPSQSSQSQRRNVRDQRISPDQSQDPSYDFSGINVPPVGNYAPAPGYPANVQSGQASRPHDQYGAGGQFSSPDPAFQGYRDNVSVPPMDQRFMGVDSGLSRRGTRRDPSMPQSHAQSFQPSPPHASSTNFPDYRSSTGPTSYWPAGSANQPPFDSPSPSSSSDGSTNMKYESTTLSLSPREALPHLPIEDYLRQEIPALPRNGPVNLWALPEPSPGARPPLTYKLLASLAIFGSPYKRLSLQEIYENIEQRFAWYRNQSEEEKKKWQGSLRHNLSLECIFRHNGRPVAEPGKGGYWTLTNADGYGQKRPRKRRGKTSKERAKAEDEVDQLLEDDEDVQIQGHPGGRLVRSSPVPQHSAQASPYAPGPQPGSSFGGGPMSSSDSFNPGVVFGQPSFPPPGPMRNFGQDPVPRMQSLPTMGNRPGSRQALTRSATSPLPGMQSYHSMPGTDDGQRRHGYEYGQYQEQGAMDVDEDSRRARGSRRMDKGMRRGYN